MLLKIKILLIALALIPSMIFGQIEKRETKRVAYKVAEAPQVSVTNKYGNIHFIEWDKDSVVFDVNYTVRSTNPQTVDALYQMISFSNFGNQYHVMMETKLQMDYNNVNNLLRSITAGSNTISIHYTVYHPKGAQLKAENKFGNIIMNNAQGSVDITLDNGDLTAGKISGFLILDMSFGNATLQSVNEGNITFNSGDLDIRKANKLQLQTKMSRINLEDVKQLNINSLRDKYHIGATTQVSGKSTFSFINIYSIDQSIQMSMKYGGVNVNKSATSLKSIAIDGDYSTITIYLHSTLDADFEITYTQGTSIDLPSNAKITSKTPTPEVKNQFKSMGQIGEKPATAKIRIKNKEGQISIINI